VAAWRLPGKRYRGAGGEEEVLRRGEQEARSDREASGDLLPASLALTAAAAANRGVLVIEGVIFGVIFGVMEAEGVEAVVVAVVVVVVAVASGSLGMTTIWVRLMCKREGFMAGDTQGDRAMCCGVPNPAKWAAE
jgi:hypothetical protein